jgi:hypothetical protein
VSPAPEPTPDGYEWVCSVCPWSGRSLADAKAHLLTTEADPDITFSHMPYESQVGATGEMFRRARRVMNPSEKEGTVLVATYEAVKRRRNALFKQLAEDLRARGGRLRNG